MSGLAIGAAQTTPRRDDVDANLAEHLRLARTAGEAGAGLLVFPELSLTGYELALASQLAFSESDARLDPLRALADSLQMTLVVGAPVRVAEQLHIAAFIIGRAGALALYTKQHLGAFPAEVNPGGPVPPPEPSIFQAGSLDPLVAVHGARAAVAICADTGHASHAQAAADRGAQLYLASMFFTPGEVEQEHARLQSYAARHRLLVVASNYGGPTGSLPSGGHSAIWSSEGALITRIAATRSGIALAQPTGSGWHGTVID
jgi:predicted amidohydrolase